MISQPKTLCRGHSAHIHFATVAQTHVFIVDMAAQGNPRTDRPVRLSHPRDERTARSCDRAASSAGRTECNLHRRPARRRWWEREARLTKSLLECLVAAGVLAASSSCGRAATEGPASAAAVASDPLYEKMLALDTALFDSFNECSDPAQLARHAAFFDADVEFYHDLGGLTQGVDALMANTRKNVRGKFRRQLDVASFRVYPIRGFGAPLAWSAATSGMPSCSTTMLPLASVFDGAPGHLLLARPAPRFIVGRCWGGSSSLGSCLNSSRGSS
jgi:hypothetical protein